MAKDNEPRIKGRRSYVLAGKTRGGTLVVRIDQDLHQRLAIHCKASKMSMNRYIERMLEESLRFVRPPESTK